MQDPCYLTTCTQLAMSPRLCLRVWSLTKTRDSLAGRVVRWSPMKLLTIMAGMHDQRTHICIYSINQLHSISQMPMKNIHKFNHHLDVVVDDVAADCIIVWFFCKITRMCTHATHACITMIYISWPHDCSRSACIHVYIPRLPSHHTNLLIVGLAKCCISFHPWCSWLACMLAHDLYIQHMHAFVYIT